MPPASLRFTGIGTEWQVDTVEPLADPTIENIRATVEEFDRVYSRFREDSTVSEFATAGGPVSFPPGDEALFELYDELFRLTDGAVTPLVGGALEHLGYDREYSLQRRNGSVVPQSWPDAVQREGTTLSSISPALIDVGAAGKGYLVDLVGGVLRDAGIRSFTIDASGDLLHAGAEPLRVALEHPFDPTKAIGIAELGNGSLCASGSNRRVWGEGLHHILDGRTGLPASDVLATWVVAPTGLLADGLATALFFSAPAVLAVRFEFEWVRMFSSGVAERSLGFNGELFS
jgi:thiamine biosynthesis lipoprotein